MVLPAPNGSSVKGNAGDMLLVALALAMLGVTMANSAEKIKDILNRKKGSIKNAPLPEGSPSWDDIKDKTFGEIDRLAQQGKTGYRTLRKLLTDQRFDKAK